MKRICFVCLGNIVRSPLAENMFRQHAENQGLAANYAVDSAGTSAFHVGERPDSRMREVARKRGLEYSGSARQFQPEDFEQFDLVIAMDQDNRRQLQKLAASPEQEKKIRLMREFDPQAGGDQGVPDPYYGGIQGFERVYDIIHRSTKELLKKLEEDGSS